MRMRLAGKSYREIGDSFGVTKQRIQQLLSPSADVKREVLDRARGRCELCGGSNDRLHIHHRKTVTNAYNEHDNLTVLCTGCHRNAHL